MNEKIKLLVDNIELSIIGKHDCVIKIITALLCKGHILIEDVPGVGKTKLAAVLARSVNGEFNRIQLTPDIMPSDITGFSMINQSTGESSYHKGAAMCNFLLADEINRASPKSQSSLLEVMEEHQISLDGNTYQLPNPFMVLATQNPIETYGTYHLPEAQMDRFLMRISMGYPSFDEEISILENNHSAAKVNPVISIKDITDLQSSADKVNVAPKVKEYLMSIVHSTRNNDNVLLGISPRGSIALYKAAKAFAFINERDYVTPNDIKYLACSVLSHRILLSPKGKNTFSSNENFIGNIIENTVVPL